LHFIAYGDSSVLSNVAIGDDSVVVVMPTIGCVVSDVKTLVNPTFYSVQGENVLWRGSKNGEG
jgi:hypothetical protein